MPWLYEKIVDPKPVAYFFSVIRFQGTRLLHQNATTNTENSTYPRGSPACSSSDPKYREFNIDDEHLLTNLFTFFGLIEKRCKLSVTLEVSNKDHEPKKTSI